jgi:hypothetical protein
VRFDLGFSTGLPCESTLSFVRPRTTARIALIQGITDILRRQDVPGKEKKSEMLQTLDDITEALQANYTVVVHHHLVVKRKALS